MARLLQSFLCALTLLPAVALGQFPAKVGDVSLSVPAPEGFKRLDGVNKDVDDIMLQLVPPSNRLLLFFAQPEAVAAAKKGKPKDLERYMMLQTFRQTESMKLTQKNFAEIAGSVEKEFASNSKASKELEATVNKLLKKSKDLGDLKLGETVMLGVYEKTDTSIDFGMLMTAKVGEGEDNPMAAGISIALIRGKIFYLYVYSGFQEAGDIAWTRQTVKDWREAVAAANAK